MFFGQVRDRALGAREHQTAFCRPVPVVARDLATGTATSTRPRAEDHPAGTLDDHRRRVLSTTVEIRNFAQESP